MGGHGQTGDIETTALAALALLRAGRHPDLANPALIALVRQKDTFGTWHNTSATVMALKALIQSVRAGAENVNADVTVTVNGGQARTVKVTRENFDVVQLLSFDDARAGDNQVQITVAGQGNLMYQVAGEYYLPWDVVSSHEQSPAEQPVTIDVRYDRAQLAVDETVTRQRDGAAKPARPGRPGPDRPGAAARLRRAGRRPGRTGRTRRRWRARRHSRARGRPSREGRRAASRALRADRAPDPGLHQQPEPLPADQLQLPAARPVPPGGADPSQHSVRLL